MTRPADEPPPLPAPLQDELFAALFGDPADRDEALRRLRAKAGEHLDAVEAHLRYHETLSRPDPLSAIEVPGYSILEPLGEGGMGVVYLAEQQGQLQRRVALKVVKPGTGSRELLDRFERERQSLALMEHEAIARVYDCGATTTGQPFVAMEYVEGLPIDRFCDRRRLSLRDRIGLLQQVCRGVQHAHQKGVIHRDLKPTNVLVTERDGEPMVKIIDFGIARAVLPEDPEERLFTRVGQLVGTPEYVSPEQAGGEVDRVDTRSDVYSLGVMLYELVTGDLPFAQRDGGAITPWDLVRRVREEQAPRPSARLVLMGDRAAEVAERRRTTVGSLHRQLRTDLDWVILRALEREPGRRYASASELADDLQRYLDGRAVEAGPPSRWYRASKVLRRNRLGFSAAGGFVAVLLIALATTQSALARVQRSQARLDGVLGIVMLEDGRRQADRLLHSPKTELPELERWMATFGAPLESGEGIDGAKAELAAIARDPDLSAAARANLVVQLERHVAELEDFRQHEVMQVGATLSFLTQLEALPRDHPNAGASWDEARAAIRQGARYRELPIDLVPQTGLVPIGANPVTGLWEFYHLRSGTDLAARIDLEAVSIPRHGDDGAIAVGDDTGIVFVLLPGGRCTLGGQRDDPNSVNYDPDVPEGYRTREVTIEPFFLARHELTRGQWRRLAGEEARCYFAIGFPLRRAGGAVGYPHPVENVNWFEATALLRSAGLLLPSQDQWEYGCRADGGFPWSFGRDELDLRGKANLLDLDTRRAHPEWLATPVPWPDDHEIFARAGAYPANGFGLHEMHGNLWEWCSDEQPLQQRAGGGEIPAATAELRVMRGGCFQSSSREAKFWYDAWPAADAHHNIIGCRAARVLQR